MKNNSISVIIPTYNRPKELYQALNSVYNQTIMPSEIIVIDDASEFENRPVIDSYDMPITYYRFDTNQGGNVCRNKGIELAKGEFIAFLDDDDEFAGNKIQIIKNEIAKNPQIDLFYHPAEIHMVNENIVYFSKPKEFSSLSNAFNKLLLENYIGGTSMVVCKKKTLVELGLFDTQLPSLQDYELWLRFLERKKNIKLINSPLTIYYHYTNKNSITKSIDKNKMSIKRIENKFKYYYNNLSKEENNYRKTRKSMAIVHKAILNKQIIKAQRELLRLSKRNRNIKYFIGFLSLFFGIKFFFKLKSKI